MTTQTTGNRIVEDPLRRLTFGFSTEDGRLRVEVWTQPGGGLPMHIHPNQDEWFSFLAGETRLTVGSDTWVGTPGERVSVPKGTQHGFVNVGGGEAHILVECRPSLRLEEFLERSSEFAKAGLHTRRNVPRSLSAALLLADFVYTYRETAVVTKPPIALQRITLPPLAMLHRLGVALFGAEPVFRRTG